MFKTDPSMFYFSDSAEVQRGVIREPGGGSNRSTTGRGTEQAPVLQLSNGALPEVSQVKGRAPVQGLGQRLASSSPQRIGTKICIIQQISM